MPGYYDDRLSADRLKLCYHIAPPRIRQYLDAEWNFIMQKIKQDDLVLELGCGYGRVLSSFAQKAESVIGIDTSLSSLMLANKTLDILSNCFVVQMDAINLAFPDRTFDVVVCIQNGISAFHVDQKAVMDESIRVTRHKGIVLFSSYSEKFWNHRLEWFQLQSDAGLLGEIDFDQTHNGVIVCKDGFTATTVDRDTFYQFTAGVDDIEVHVEEVDDSSIFCVIKRT